jgi:hypothetical protein
MRINVLLTAFFVVIALVSCEKDEDLFASDNPLVGKWEVTQEYHYFEDGVEQTEEDPISSFDIEFYNNFTGKKITSYNVEVEFNWMELPAENQILLEYPATHSTLTNIVDQFDISSAGNAMQTWELERDPIEKYRFSDGSVLGTNDTTGVERLEEIKWELIKIE